MESDATMIYFESEELTIRDMMKKDADIFYNTYLSYGWHPSIDTYLGYYEEQMKNKRKVFVAVYKGKVAATGDTSFFRISSNESITLRFSFILSLISVSFTFPIISNL